MVFTPLFKSSLSLFRNDGMKTYFIKINKSNYPKAVFTANSLNRKQSAIGFTVILLSKWGAEM
jgi:hypothetical protein